MISFGIATLTEKVNTKIGNSLLAFGLMLTDTSHDEKFSQGNTYPKQPEVEEKKLTRILA